MNNFLRSTGRVLFVILLIIFAAAFFLQKQYLLCFLTLALILMVSRWDQVKKLIISKNKVEVEIPKEVSEGWPKKPEKKA